VVDVVAAEAMPLEGGLALAADVLLAGAEEVGAGADMGITVKSRLKANYI